MPYCVEQGQFALKLIIRLIFRYKTIHELQQDKLAYFSSVLPSYAESLQMITFSLHTTKPSEKKKKQQSSVPGFYM